ncbi:MAG: Holliday junction branch migration protein RuvA [Propionibacteriaceae bacterium]|nr:Holliday junction branch migration protein RuvA [Propionibacteriaceae bacterium]
MIAQLRGEVVVADSGGVVLDVGGVGFRVSCPPGVGGVPGAQMTLATSLVVKEDSLSLYGFLSPSERDAFELLLTASGIGGRTALACISVLPLPELVGAIRSENLAALTRVPGIGKKGAQKLVIELKDKVLALGNGDDLLDGTGASQPPDWREQVLAGLQGLGWGLKDAESACEAVAPLVAENPALPIGQIMRAALQGLAR